jgi:multidrug resistance efflux pump
VDKTTTARVDEQIDAEIAALVAQVREANEQISELQAEIEVAKSHLRELLEQRGSNWSDDDGYARLTSEGVRISYDTKALDELIIKQPLQYGWLKDFRREAHVSGSIQVK